MSASLITSLDQLASWPVHFPKDHVIYDEGDPSECMYLVERGCVRLQVNGAKGTRQIVSFLLPGDLFGFCSSVRNTAAEAVTDVSLLRYSAKALFSNGVQSISLSRDLMDGVNQSYRDLAHHIESVVHEPASVRVSAFYQWLKKRLGPEGVDKPPMTQRDIADFLGLAPETLSRCLQAAQKNEPNRDARESPRGDSRAASYPTSNDCRMG